MRETIRGMTDRVSVDLDLPRAYPPDDHLRDVMNVNGRPLVVEGIEPFADRYDLILCDVWCVLHNGVSAYAAASDALTRFRRAGGEVVLVSNAPRPGDSVAVQLDGFGVPRSAYDAVVTSGDLT